jgi:hypothetical protein
MPIGALIGGLVTNQYDVRIAIVVSGCMLLMVGLLIPLVLRPSQEYGPGR